MTDDMLWEIDPPDERYEVARRTMHDLIDKADAIIMWGTTGGTLEAYVYNPGLAKPEALASFLRAGAYAITDGVEGLLSSLDDDGD